MKILTNQLNPDGIYWSSTYNKVLDAAKMLFNRNCIFADADNNRLTITDRITLVFSFSNNETKAYIYTYKGSLTEENNNYCPRLMDIKSIVKYLQIKAEENNFLINNEG